MKKRQNMKLFEIILSDKRVFEYHLHSLKVKFKYSKTSKIYSQTICFFTLLIINPINYGDF